MSNIPSNFRDGQLVATDDAAHSATLLMDNGDLSLDNVLPDGAALAVSESRGAVVGLRKGARAYPTLTISSVAAKAGASFMELVQGKTSGFTSVTADIGDYAAVDLAFDYSYGAESRSLSAQDCVLTSWSFAKGDPNNTCSFTFTIYGPLTIDGIAVIASR